MYRRSKFQELLIEIRQEMAREADFDTDLFVELARRETQKSDRQDKPDDSLRLGRKRDKSFLGKS